MSNVRRLRRNLVRSDFERMNLPYDFWRATVQDVPDGLRDIIHRYLVNTDAMMKKGAGLLLMGEPGVGKTGIAALVVKEARARGYTTFFTTVWELRECVKTRIDFEPGIPILHRCRQVDVLVLDGLDLDYVKDFHLDAHAIEELIRFRGAQRRVTIITTRLDADTLDAKMPGLLTATQGCMVALRVAGPNKREQRDQELNRVVLEQD
jgi:DNA replication protein DnaC